MIYISLTDVTPDQISAARALDVEDIFQDLHAIGLRSAARLQGHEILTDADLYDEDGLPA